MEFVTQVKLKPPLALATPIPPPMLAIHTLLVKQVTLKFTIKWDDIPLSE